MSGRSSRSRRWLRLGPGPSSDARQEVDDEMRSHVEHRAAQLVEEGWDAASAEAEAWRLFYVRPETIRSLHHAARDRNRRMRMRERLESWREDIRYAARGLGRDPVMASFVVLTLSLGIGLNVAAFSLVDRLMLRDPAHVSEPEALVRLYGSVSLASIGDVTSAWIPWPVYESLRADMTTLEGITAYRVDERVVGRGVAARTMRVGQTMDGFFQVLGVRALRGRFVGAGEDGSVAGVAVVSSRYWETVLGGDPGAIGQTITVGEAEHEIVGVAPPGFAGTGTRRIDIWIPGTRGAAGTMNWNIVGRVRNGVSPEEVTAEVVRVFARTRERAPAWFRNADLVAGSVRLDDSGREPLEATMARWLAAVSAVILLVALANSANLLLVRLARRRRELAVRVALGSGRGRVIRLIALEGSLLALLSGLASLWMARLSEPVLRHALFADEASWSFSLVDWRLLGVCLLCVLATALATGLVPAIKAWGPGLNDALRSGAQGGGSGSARTRGVLTVVQAALSVLLLVGAGVFVRSLARVGAVDLGVDRDAVIVATAHLPRPAEFTSDAFAAARELEIDVYRRLEAAVARVPGVERTAMAVGLPLDGGSFSAAVFVDGIDSVPTLPGGGPYASAVGPGYFATAGTRLLRGRTFTDADRSGAERVIVIGQTMADRLWPGGDPLDACVRIGRSDWPCYRVIGIVEDVHRVALREQPSLQYYVPVGQQEMFGGASLLIRPSAGRGVSWPEIRRVMLDADPSIQAVELRWMREALDGETRPLRLGVVTFGLSGMLALVVVVMGLYGLMSYMVTWRTREIGVRLAIGATGVQITRMVIGSGVGLAGLGVAIGLMVSFWAGRWVEPHLFETSSADPMVFGGVAAVLLAVAAVAGWVPARRALAISPTEALRSE